MKEITGYWRGICLNISWNWLHASIWSNLINAIGSILMALWAGIGGLYICVVILTIMDVFVGVSVSLRKGHSFSSRKLRKGLVEKVLLYTLLFIATYVLEHVIKTSIPYHSFYLVGFATAVFGFYEVSSLMEGLIYLYSEYPFLKRLSKFLHILDTRLENKTANNIIKNGITES